MDIGAKVEARNQLWATLTKLKQVVAREPPLKLSEADTKAEFIDKYVAALGYEGLEDVVRDVECGAHASDDTASSTRSSAKGRREDQRRAHGRQVSRGQLREATHGAA